jgi:hypothetical protein
MAFSVILRVPLGSAQVDRGKRSVASGKLINDASFGLHRGHEWFDLKAAVPLGP